MKATSAPETGLLLAGGMCLLPFVLPFHRQPVLTFYLEWLAVALGIAAALALLAGRRFARDAALPAPVPWLAAFAAFLLLQAALGESAYFQIPLLATLYVLYAMLMLQLGGQLVATFGIDRVAVILAACVLAGALANSAAGVIQFYGRPKILEDVVAEMIGPRAYGNIAQSNLYSNYLALGQGALLFLWLRASLRTSFAIAALALLVVASALSGARSALLYAIWFAALGAWSARALPQTDAKRLAFGTYAVAAALAAAHLLVPWVNAVLHIGVAGEGSVERMVVLSEQRFEPRLPVFLLALRIFAAAPISGAGMGEFPGAAFKLGLEPSLTGIGDVWTSPHNLPLHLLAETGLVGASLVFGGLLVWAAQLVRRYRSDASPALWWIVAAVGVELIHSLIEYPLWSANFLGLAALLVGASTLPRSRPPSIARAARLAGFAVCAALSVTLAILLRDYVRLDMARAAGTRVTLAPAAQVQRDVQTMRGLRESLLAPVAELWIFSGAPLDRSDLATKLTMGARVSRVWPSNVIVVRRAVFLALDGKPEEARVLLASALRAFPQRHAATVALLEQALAADREIIGPLLAMAESSRADKRKKP